MTWHIEFIATTNDVAQHAITHDEYLPADVKDTLVAMVISAYTQPLSQPGYTSAISASSAIFVKSSGHHGYGGGNAHHEIRLVNLLQPVAESAPEKPATENL